MTTAEKITLWLLLALLTSPAWLYAAACIYDQAMKEPSDYPFSGFCPDSPEHFDTADFF